MLDAEWVRNTLPLFIVDSKLYLSMLLKRQMCGFQNNLVVLELQSHHNGKCFLFPVFGMNQLSFKFCVFVFILSRKQKE